MAAADDWGKPTLRRWVLPALPDSIEELAHDVSEKEFFLAFSTAPRAADVLRVARLEGAIGVIYRPETNGRVRAAAGGSSA